MRKAIGLTLIVAGLAVGVAWSNRSFAHPFAPVIALVLFLVGASMFGQVSRLAAEISKLEGKTVRVKVWGTDLGDGGFELKSVSGIGPGLHVYLRPLPEGKVRHLKIAQPRGAVVGATGAEVVGAKYIQLDGKRITKPEIAAEQPLPKAFLMGIDER
jgi:xanthosine utilization system XapX-like protein